MTSSSKKSDPITVVVLASGSGTLLQAILDQQDGQHDQPSRHGKHGKHGNHSQGAQDGEDAASYRVARVVADIPCEALNRAEAAGVDTHVVELGADRAAWNVALADAVGEADPDVIVSAGFMKVLGEQFLERFEGITINTHPALLPSFPGAHAVRDALAYGVKVTGSTVHFIDAGVDTGRIIAQHPVAVAAEDTEATLHEKIKQIERELIVSVLRSARTDTTTRKVDFTHE